MSDDDSVGCSLDLNDGNDATNGDTDGLIDGGIDGLVD